MGQKIPKQFLEIDGKPILFYTLEKFEMCDSVNEIILIVPEPFLQDTEKDVESWAFKKVRQIVAGGKERQDSVQNGLNVLSSETNIVLIHDGVRPFVRTQKIKSIIEATKEHGAAILAVPSKNTIKKVEDGWVRSTLDRNVLWQVQTPQGFKKDILLNAFDNARQKGVYGTDDAMLVEASGHPVKVVEGDEQNIKITCPNDLLMANTWIKAEKQ